MKISNFDYKLPPELVADEPIRPRDYSRLLFLSKESGKTLHRKFYEIGEFLRPGDLLVMNNSKVFSARLLGKKKETGGAVEILLNREKNGVWQCLLGGRNLKPNLEIDLSKKLFAKVLKNNQNGSWEVEFNLRGSEFMKEIERIGKVPLPPYIEKRRCDDSLFELQKSSDKKSYQTVYADNLKIGSAAAPTAGLHFTRPLIAKLKKQGVEFAFITLHVGLGTFAPLKEKNIKEKKLHSEYVEVSGDAIEAIRRAKTERRRVIAVGTTSVRTLEAVFGNTKRPPLAPPCLPAELKGKGGERIVPSLAKGFRGDVDIFIYPGYKFRVIDGMITNFHLPKTSLIMLVSALAGKENIQRAYREAIKKKYRFYSYGDAMLILDY